MPSRVPRGYPWFNHFGQGFREMTVMRMLAKAAVATVLATTALAQSAKDVRGASPYIEIKNEPAPKLVVDQPLPEGLANGLFWAQYRVENVHIQQVFGEGALKVSPRVGHLHIQVDDSPFLWADASDINTIDVAFFTPGQHKVKIDLVDPNHNVFPGQSVTLTFNILKAAGGTAPAQPHGPPK
jgi:hypothetical protein